MGVEQAIRTIEGVQFNPCLLHLVLSDFFKLINVFLKVVVSDWCVVITLAYHFGTVYVKSDVSRAVHMT